MFAKEELIIVYNRTKKNEEIPYVLWLLEPEKILKIIRLSWKGDWLCHWGQRAVGLI